MREITFKNHHRLGRYNDVSPFVVDGELELRFNGLDIINGEIHARSKINGREFNNLLTSDKKLTLSADKLSSGILQISVAVYIHGAKAAAYEVEPLTIIEAEHTFEAEPLIQTLRGELLDLRQLLLEKEYGLQGQMTALRGKLDAYRDTCNDTITAKHAEGMAEFETALEQYKHNVTNAVAAVANTVDGYIRPKKKEKKK